ncbi:HPF/RaiA family ribosome-associated protein [Paracraurococcus lichenis]|uniref:HPF/RaiA family ribosome-associated protein n=1 Tax=Paracraurococcus lichenis TaxID=3064888 RepID=A0ABT9E7R6_9PROT|nr:HPF/RaiA family ribosome-associated protein [Paracraurococcus sp. LOR1-02]MDO9712219.1 HPF/RaiA family ribosome-associated protein [Paracraurococcus sp. LOR1-02]
MSSSLDADIPENTRVMVAGRHLDLGEVLIGHVETEMRTLADKYFRRAADATVTFSRTAKGSGFCCNIRFHVAGDLDFDGRASHKEAHAALSLAVEHVAKQLRRTKRARREDKPVNFGKANLFKAHAERVTEPDDALGMVDTDETEYFESMFPSGSSPVTLPTHASLPLAAE